MSAHTFGLCLISAAALVAAAPAAGTAAVVFTGNYEADALPDASAPVWVKGGTFRVEPSVNAGVLSIDTGPDIFKTGYFQQAASWDGDTTTGSTVEVRVRQVSGTGRLQLAHKTGTTGWFYDLLLSTSRIAAAEAINDLNPAGGNGSDLDMTQFRTIRLVLGAGNHGGLRTLDVYVDGSATKAFSLNGYSNNSANRILIGDGASSGGGGVVEYDYIRWTNAEATPPAVPEPTTGAAGAMIGLGALAVRRRRKA